MKHLLYLLNPFRRLQWKLTLSYTLITVLALLVLELILFAALFVYFNVNMPSILSSALPIRANEALPYFSGQTPDRLGLSRLLKRPSRASADSVMTYEGYIAVVDMQGMVLASSGSQAPSTTIAIQTLLSPTSAGLLHSVLQGTVDPLNDPNGDIAKEPDNTIVVIAPIKMGDDVIKGALIIKASRLQVKSQQLISTILPAILISSLVFLLFAAIVGTIFGFFTARGFSRRFGKLSLVVDNWSHGDFTKFVLDTSGDEVGQLSRRMNRMAEQLQNLVQTRQKLASLEERNRLARDLHDSVKQQVFAVSMQVSAARVLLGRDVDAAGVRLAEAEKLVRQAQQELTTLIRELRPVALEGKGLPLALQEYVADWSRQAGISANLKVEGEQPIPLLVEEAFYRVAQEALSNVARHSKALAVQLVLTCSYDGLKLSVTDNGCGFDIRKRGHGVGLLSMNERMQAFGGCVEIESATGKGTTLIAKCAHVHIAT